MNSISALNEHRVIQLEGTSNFRDIGGYKNKEGLTLRWGQLYRSANLAGLSASDQNQLQELGVSESIDLRSQFEQQKSAYEYPFLNVYKCSIEPQVTDAVFTAITARQALTVDQTKDFMHQMYRGFVLEQQDRFAQFFDLVIARQGAAVVHCTAGKDRTGFACAMLQSALGVHRDDILADYLLTQQCYLVSLARTSQEYGLPEDIMQILWGVEAEYLDSALDLINTQFGSLTHYLEDQLQLNSTKQKELKEQFLHAE
ncbi:MAG TPA: tyrosine-protein phosphatase [Paenalcaligenes sp.]|nr:tyrosine-protein phosphatase [Paenalcaligenes sp.]